MPWPARKVDDRCGGAMGQVMECRASRDYRLWLRFDDGVEGSVYLGNLLEVAAFRAWRDVDEFCRVALDPAASAIVWGGGIRLDPEILYRDLIINRSRMGFGSSELAPAAG